MRAGSFGLPPVDGEAVHQIIDDLLGIVLRIGGEVGVTGGGQDRVMAEDLLHLKQIHTGLDQMGGIGMAQTVRGDLFLMGYALH